MASLSGRIRAQESARLFNQKFPIGTVVTFNGKKTKTWSHAGLGASNEVVVFLTCQQEPVPIESLTIDGYRLEHGARARRGKSKA